MQNVTLRTMRSMVKREIIALFGEQVKKDKYFPRLVQEGLREVMEDPHLKSQASRLTLPAGEEGQIFLLH